MPFTSSHKVLWQAISVINQPTFSFKSLTRNMSHAGFMTEQNSNNSTIKKDSLVPVRRRTASHLEFN